MAEEKKVKKDHGKWFREMRSELKKVVWPDAKTTAKNTGTVLLHRSVPLNNAEKRPAAFPAFCAAFPAPRHNPGRQAHCPAPDHKTGSGVGTPTALPRAECGAGRC